MSEMSLFDLLLSGIEKYSILDVPVYLERDILDVPVYTNGNGRGVLVIDSLISDL